MVKDYKIIKHIYSNLQTNRTNIFLVEKNYELYTLKIMSPDENDNINGKINYELYTNPYKKIYPKIKDIENIVKIYDFWWNNEKFYLLSEYLEGSSVYDAEKNGWFQFEEKREILSRMMLILSEIYNRNIVILDPSPRNFIITEDKSKLTMIDFDCLFKRETVLQTDHLLEKSFRFLSNLIMWSTLKSEEYYD